MSRKLIFIILLFQFQVFLCVGVSLDILDTDDPAMYDIPAAPRSDAMRACSFSDPLKVTIPDRREKGQFQVDQVNEPVKSGLRLPGILGKFSEWMSWFRPPHEGKRHRIQTIEDVQRAEDQKLGFEKNYFDPEGTMGKSLKTRRFRIPVYRFDNSEVIEKSSLSLTVGKEAQEKEPTVSTEKNDLPPVEVGMQYDFRF